MPCQSSEAKLEPKIFSSICGKWLNTYQEQGRISYQWKVVEAPRRKCPRAQKCIFRIEYTWVVRVDTKWHILSDIAPEVWFSRYIFIKFYDSMDFQDIIINIYEETITLLTQWRYYLIFQHFNGQSAEQFCKSIYFYLFSNFLEERIILEWSNACLNRPELRVYSKKDHHEKESSSPELW